MIDTTTRDIAAVPHAMGAVRGFADPVHDVQQSFRAVLGAMAEPGVTRRLEAIVAPPAGLPVGAFIALLTLVDFETPVWLPPACPQAAIDALRFHTGAPIVSAASEARFAVIDGAAAAPPITAFDPGDDRYPDRSATLLVLCTGLDGGNHVTLTGPGIKRERRIAPAGLRPGFWDEVASNNARYPLGVDLLLMAGREIMGLPRSCALRLEREG